MVKKVFLKIADFLGFRRSSSYVQEYLHKANMRSGVFMAGVVAVLEGWLVIRQHQKYIINDALSGTNYFESLFNYTSLFWLLMVMGISMFIYCLYYLTKNKQNKAYVIPIIVVSLIGIILCSFIWNEARIKNYNPKRFVDTVLLIVLYSMILLFHIATIIATITRYKGKHYEWLHSVLIISLFATCLLVFGIRVSYGDFTSVITDKATGTVYPNPDYKEIICFLMMTIYVGCLLIWRPYISVAILGVIFLGFYFLLKSFDPNIRYFPEGDEVNYITFFISLVMVSISIFSQRKLEATKDEELLILATQDKLTDLLSFEYFLTLVDEKIAKEDTKEKEWVYLFLNVCSFKVYNDQRGYFAGNEFLKNVGKVLSEVFPNSYISRQSDDHFVAFVPNINFDEKIKEVADKIKALDKDIKPEIIVGGCLFDMRHDDAHTSIEKARYAYAELKSKGGRGYLQYNKEMHDKYIMVQYIVAKIDEAVEKDWVVAYYQPVVRSKDRTLCGVECLARWIDPKFGFLSPGTFIPALEDAQLAYKLDLKMLEIVCKNMRRILDNKETIVPTSINFSRADFSIIDVPDEVFKITSKYGIPPKYLHIEITESALLDEHVDLKDAMRRLKEKGFELWLDDFGSGYSSFNTLKDYEFDVLKLDMEFLKGFEKNEKSKPLIKAVIDLAGQVGMRTLCEGVETEEQAKFLSDIDCEKLQGYLMSKPISYEDLNAKIRDGTFVISKNLD